MATQVVGFHSNTEAAAELKELAWQNRTTISDLIRDALRTVYGIDTNR